MKKSLTVAIVAVIAIVGAASASAQFRWGIKAGVCVNTLKFDESNFDADNRAGFTGGVMAEFTVPLIGVGADISAMYVRRSDKWMREKTDYTEATTYKANQDYIDIPVNIKWRINIPVINNIIRPYLVTGPDFAFRCSKKTISDIYHSKNVSYSWNFGFGLELLKHLQVGATYGLGLNKTLKAIDRGNSAIEIEGKNRYWMITAAYLF